MKWAFGNHVKHSSPLTKTVEGIVGLLWAVFWSYHFSQGLLPPGLSMLARVQGSALPVQLLSSLANHLQSLQLPFLFLLLFLSHMRPGPR